MLSNKGQINVKKKLVNHLTFNNLYAFNVRRKDDVCFELFIITDETTFIPQDGTNVNLLYLPDSIEIASLEGLTLWCPEINQSKQLLAYSGALWQGSSTEN